MMHRQGTEHHSCEVDIAQYDMPPTTVEDKLVTTANVRSRGVLAPGFVWAFRLLRLATSRVGLFIQERPQREILRAGAISVKKLLDVGICGAPAG
jgi:hypothetical protein